MRVAYHGKKNSAKKKKIDLPIQQIIGGKIRKFLAFGVKFQIDRNPVKNIILSLGAFFKTSLDELR